MKCAPPFVCTIKCRTPNITIAQAVIFAHVHLDTSLHTLRDNVYPFNLAYNTIHMYSGITSGRVLDGELLYTKILEVNLFAFAYRLFRRDLYYKFASCI